MCRAPRSQSRLALNLSIHYSCASAAFCGREIVNVCESNGRDSSRYAFFLFRAVSRDSLERVRCFAEAGISRTQHSHFQELAPPGEINSELLIWCFTLSSSLRAVAKSPSETQSSTVKFMDGVMHREKILLGGNEISKVQRDFVVWRSISTQEKNMEIFM